MKQLSVRAPLWAGICFGIAVLAAGAVFLSLGLVLAIAFLILAGFALLPSWLRRLWPSKRPHRGPVTIEGHYTKCEQ